MAWLTFDAVLDTKMGTVERAGDATSEVESGEEEEIVGGGELAQHLMKRWEIG